jgi:hypothetical protein
MKYINKFICYCAALFKIFIYSVEKHIQEFNNIHQVSFQQDFPAGGRRMEGSQTI